MRHQRAGAPVKRKEMHQSVTRRNRNVSQKCKDIQEHSTAVDEAVQDKETKVLTKGVKHSNQYEEPNFQTQDLQQSIQHLEQTFKETERQNLILEQKNQDLENRIRTLYDDAAILCSSHTDLLILKAKLEELENELNEKNKINKAMAEENDTLKEKLNTKEVKLAVATTEVKHVSEMMNKYKTEWQQWKENAEAFRKKCEEMTTQLAEANTRVKHLMSLVEQGSTEDMRSGMHIC